MFTTKPHLCAHCEHAMWSLVKGSGIQSHRILRCLKTGQEAIQPCGYFEKVDLRKNLLPGQSIIYNGREYHALEQA